MKKITSILLVFTLMFTMGLGLTANAASKKTVKLGKSGYTATVYGKESSTLWQFSVGGNAAFCLARDSQTNNGKVYTATSYQKAGLTKDQWQEINLIANVGYNKTKGRTGKDWRGATQLYMWKRLKDWKIKNNTSSYGNTSTVPKYSSKASTIKSEVAAFKKVKDNPISFNGKTVKFKDNKSANSETLNDSKKVLKNYKVKKVSNSNVTAKIDGNSLKITTKAAIKPGTYKVTLSWSPYTPVVNDAQMFYTSSSQTLACAGKIKPMTATVSVSVGQEKRDEEKTGNIEIEKAIDSMGDEANLSLIGEEPDYTKIEFGFYAKTDIKDKDGNVKHKAGSLVKTVPVSEDGKIRISGILAGTYKLKETKTLPGLVLNNAEFEIVAKKNASGGIDVDTDTEVPVLETHYNLTMAEKLQAMNMISIDAGDEFTEEIAIEKAQAKAFSLDEATLDNDEPTETGEVPVTADISGVDASAPGAYNVSFTTEKGSTISTRVIVVDPNADETEYDDVIYNDTTKVSISKTDVTGQEEVPGADMTLTDSEGNKVAEWTSTDEAYVIEGLEVGKEYTLTEVVAPDGYVLSTDSVTFTVEATGNMQQHYMKDKWVEFYKTDKDGKIITGGEFEITDKETGDIAESFKGDFQDVGKSVEDGKGYLVSNLKAGHTYIVHEVKAPKGYMIAEDVEFTVENDEENQTVVMEDEKSSIKTTATVGGKHDAKVSKETVLVDKVEYKNLTVGQEYTLKGTLMDSTGNPLKINGKKVTSTVKFTPKSKDGYQNMKFTFDSTGLDGKSTVVFEKLYIGKELVTTHEDINDKDQTVKFHDKDTPQTGDNMPVWPFIVIIGCIALIAIVIVNRKK